MDNARGDLPGWKSFLVFLHDVCRYGAAFMGLLFIVAAILMYLDRDANEVDFDLVGSIVWLALVSALFSTLIFRKSYLALIGETVTAVAVGIAVALIAAGGSVWLDRNPGPFDDAHQSIRLGDAMRRQARDFIDQTMTDPELWREVMERAWSIAIWTLAAIAIVFACRAIAIQTLKNEK